MSIFNLEGNNVTEIREGDVEKFKSLQVIDLSIFFISAIEWNPLSG
jgi:hypothetical protein